LPDLARAADELRRQEFSRLAAAVTPRPEQLRSMTATALRDEIAQMWQRLGHDVITRPDAAELVTVKANRKFITACANPADAAPAGSAALCRLRGFYVSVRGFTAEGELYAETAPVQLIDAPHPRAASQPQGHTLASGLQSHVPALRRDHRAPPRQRRGPALRPRTFCGADDCPRRFGEAAAAGIKWAASKRACPGSYVQDSQVVQHERHRAAPPRNQGAQSPHASARHQTTAAQQLVMGQLQKTT
jgi:hypothetical protein